MDIPDPGIELGSPEPQVDFLPTDYQGSPNGAVRTFNGRLILGNSLPRNFIFPLYISKCSLSVQRAQYDPMRYTLVIYTFLKINFDTRDLCRDK